MYGASPRSGKDRDPSHGLMSGKPMLFGPLSSASSMRYQVTTADKNTKVQLRQREPCGDGRVDGWLTVIGHPVRPVAATFLHHGVVYACQHATHFSRGLSGSVSTLHIAIPLYSAIAFASFNGSRSRAPEAFRVTLFMKWYVGQFAVVPLPDVSVPNVHCIDTAAAREEENSSSSAGSSSAV